MGVLECCSGALIAYDSELQISFFFFFFVVIFNSKNADFIVKIRISLESDSAVKIRIFETRIILIAIPYAEAFTINY